MKTLKTILFAILLIAITAPSFGQLNKNALIIKENNPEMYSQIKQFAAKDWKGDHSMMIYTINKQSDAMFKWVKLTERADYDKELMIDAVMQWKDGDLWNYSMIIYSYEKQLKAKNQY